LEMEHYKILKEHPDVEIVALQKTFVLFPSFEVQRFPGLKTRKVREMSYTPDFIIRVKGVDKPIAMESKGYARKDYMMRKKLFMREWASLRKRANRYIFYECKSKQQLKDDLKKVNK